MHGFGTAGLILTLANMEVYPYCVNAKHPRISLYFAPVAARTPPRPRPPHPWRLAVSVEMGRVAAFIFYETRT